MHCLISSYHISLSYIFFYIYVYFNHVTFKLLNEWHALSILCNSLWHFCDQETLWRIHTPTTNAPIASPVSRFRVRSRDAFVFQLPSSCRRRRTCFSAAVSARWADTFSPFSAIICLYNQPLGDTVTHEPEPLLKRKKKTSAYRHLLYWSGYNHWHFFFLHLFNSFRTLMSLFKSLETKLMSSEHFSKLNYLSLFPIAWIQYI